MAKKFSKLSVIRQKDVLKKQSTPKIKKNPKSLLPPDTHQGVRNFSFLENFACFDFLKHPFWDLPFWLTTDDLISAKGVIIQGVLLRHHDIFITLR